MGDIDFDELDRAVSSAGATKPKDKSSDSVAVNVGQPAVPRTDEADSASPAAKRSSGRFMDVVHPSSDMRSGKSEVPERSAPAEPERSTEVKSSFEWPDPLDVPSTHSAEEPKEGPAEETASRKPLESPFLNDTKVEKRPLGAFSADTPAPDTSLLVDEEPAKDPDEPKVEDLIDVEALKSGEKEEVKPEAPAEKASEIVADEPTVVGPTSITQQYKEHPSTTDQPSGAIFDTEDYHQALAHPVKKRSSALIIVWILALIIVGGGAGAAVYFFVLPML